MRPHHALVECLRNYAVFSGRSSRSEFWLFVLFVVLAVLLAVVIDNLLFGAAGSLSHRPFTLLAIAVLLTPALAAGWRRMHDAGRPGWLLLPPTLLYGLAAFSTVDGGDLVVLRLTEIGMTALAVFWLTRRSERRENVYGAPAEPEPAS